MASLHDQAFHDAAKKAVKETGDYLARKAPGLLDLGKVTKPIDDADCGDGPAPTKV